MLCLLALVALVYRRYRLHTRLPPLGALMGLPFMGVAPKPIAKKYRVLVRRARLQCHLFVTIWFTRRKSSSGSCLLDIHTDMGCNVYSSS